MKTTGRYIRPSVRYVVLIMCNDPMLSMKLTAENGKKKCHCARSQVLRLADGVRNKQTTPEGSRNFS